MCLRVVGRMGLSGGETIGGPCVQMASKTGPGGHSEGEGEAPHLGQ